MVGLHHQLYGREFEQAQGVGDGQGGLACYSPWGLKESDMTYQLNNNRQHIKIRRHHFADKGPYNQSYGFSSSHVWM